MIDPPECEPKREATPGQVVGGKWRIVRVIGRGGMGAVYEAQNVAIGKRAALKFIDAEQARREDVASRFRQEAEAASLVESAHIVQVFDSGTTEQGVPYIVMELLRGEDLRTRLRRLHKLPAAEAIHIIGQVLRGLHRAHEAGIVHRDLKPDNIFLVDRDDDSLFVKLVDFGISKITRPRIHDGNGPITREGAVLGTPAYMSPEQAQGLADVDPRADLWAAGAILFECLAGRPPFAGEFYESIIVAVCTSDAPLLTELDPSISPELAAIVRRSLARDRTARYQSAKQFLDALHDAGYPVGRRAGETPSFFSPLPRGQGSAPPQHKSGGMTHDEGAGKATEVAPPHVLAARAAAQSRPVAPARGPRPAIRMFWLGLVITIASFVITLVSIWSRAPSRPPRRAPSHHRAEASVADVRRPTHNAGGEPRTSSAEAIPVGSTSSRQPENDLRPVATPAAQSANDTMPPAPEAAESANGLPSVVGVSAGTEPASRAKAPARARTTTGTATHSASGSDTNPRAGVARGLEIKTTYP